jgi:hypothetical protein
MNNLFDWSDETWLTLDQIGILVGDVVLAITVAAAVVGYLNRDRLRRWLTPNRFPAVGADMQGRHWNGIVFTVSKPEVPRWVIDQLKPRCIGLVATPQSMKAAEEVMAYARDSGIEVLPLRQLDDPNDPSESKEKTGELLTTLARTGHTPLAVEITGGKTPMSLGAFMAAEERRADTLYVSVGYDQALNRLDLRSASLQCISMPN